MWAAERARTRGGSIMPTLELFMLGFVVIVAVIGLGWFIYEARSDDEK